MVFIGLILHEWKFRVLDHNVLLVLKGLCFPKEVSGVKGVIITETSEALGSPKECFPVTCSYYVGEFNSLLGFYREIYLITKRKTVPLITCHYC